MEDKQLFSLSGPHIHVLNATDSDFCDVLRSVQRRHRHAAVRVVRGHKCRTVPALFDEFASALQFPYYFGENWAAFDECLTDLEWLESTAYVIGIAHSSRLLEHAPAADFTVFERIIRTAAENWASGTAPEVTNGPRSFHVVLQSEQREDTELASKWGPTAVFRMGLD